MIDSIVGLFAAMSLLGPTQNSAALRPLPVATPIVKPQPPKKRRVDSLGIQTSSPSVFVADLASGSVLYSKNAHDLLSIASLTKLVTAMVWLDTKPDFDETITFEADDFDGEGKPVFAVGETITKGQAIESLLIGSVNAAGHALARTSLGVDAFVKAMNEKVQALNLASPTFVEPTGIDPRNRANAADVAALLSTALSYPDIRRITEHASVTVHGKSGKDYTVASTNLLLGSYLNQKPYHIVGAKTGSLPEAGFCMAQVTSDAAGHQVVAVILNSNNHFSRFQDIKGLTAWAFDTFQWE